MNLDNMKLRGFIIYGKLGLLLISIMFYSPSGELVGKTKMKETGLDGVDISVIFPTPLPLDRNTIYTAVVQINGGPTYFGIGGLRNVNFELKDRGTLKVEFQDATPGETTVNKGQIKGLIFK